MAKKASAKATVMEIPSLPPVQVLSTGQTIVPSAEKAQIESITVEKGTPGAANHTQVEIYSGKDFVEGLNPVQGQFMFNLVTGALGSGRGDRPTAFAAWAVRVADQFAEHPFFKGLLKYNVIVEYGKRGGTIVYPADELLQLCQIKSRNTQISQERFPPERKVTPRKTKEAKKVEVAINL